MIDTSAIDYILMAAEAAKARGDYDEYCRLRQRYLNEQARLYEQERRTRALRRGAR